MQEHRPDGAADEGELAAHIAAAIVDIKFCRDPIGGYGVFEHFLEVVGAVIVEEPAANKEPGVVVNDHDAVDPPALCALRDIRKIAGISLPHLAEGIFLKSFPVPEGRVAC